MPTRIADRLRPGRTCCREAHVPVAAVRSRIGVAYAAVGVGYRRWTRAQALDLPDAPMSNGCTDVKHLCVGRRSPFRTHLSGHCGGCCLWSLATAGAWMNGAPCVRIERTTFRLQGECSTTELTGDGSTIPSGADVTLLKHPFHRGDPR